MFLVQVRALLDQVSEKLATFSEVGISPAHADHIFSELTTYEEKVCVSYTQTVTVKALSNRGTNGELSRYTAPQEVLDRATALSHEGDELIQKSHYAEDSIQPKCSELRTISETVNSNLRAKKDHLLKARELHHRLERVRGQTNTRFHCNCFVLLFGHFSLAILLCRPLQASKWVDDGIYLLASQPVDKCQSHEGAELALKELERYLDNAGENQLADLSTIWKDYEAVLNQQFRVRGLTCEESARVAFKHITVPLSNSSLEIYEIKTTSVLMSGISMISHYDFIDADILEIAHIIVTLLWWLPVHQDQVEKVFQKQVSMQEMFDKRRVSLKKLAAKQTRPVQPVAPRPEAFIKSPLSSPGQYGNIYCTIKHIAYSYLDLPCYTDDVTNITDLTPAKMCMDRSQMSN